jgi:hypothetical protein
LPEIIGAGLFLSARITQSFQGDVKSDLVAMLEAIGDGIGNAVDAQFERVTYNTPKWGR